MNIECTLSPRIKKLLTKGNKAAAIKVYIEEHPGVGLEEAKDYIEALANGESPEPPTPKAVSLSPRIEKLLSEGKKSEAIKVYREEHPGAGLEEAKYCIRAAASREPSEPPKPKAILEFFEQDGQRWQQTKPLAFVCILITPSPSPAAALDESTVLGIADLLVPGFKTLSDFEVVSNAAANARDADRLIATVASRHGTADVILVPEAVVFGFIQASIGILIQASSGRQPTGIKINRIEGVGQLLRIR